MDKYSLIQPIVMALLVGLVGAACSEVEFTPAPLNGGQSIDNGKFRTDFFTFSKDKPPTKVDVLFVVDNSGSMRDEQTKLTAALSSFVDTLEDVDWQIGITTTDLNPASPYYMMGKLVKMEGTASRILTRRTTNYEQVFLDTVMANGTPLNCNSPGYPVCPSGNEQPLEASRQIVKNRATANNAGFFREGSDFVVIALSDEDEMSTGAEHPEATTAEMLRSEVNTAWNNVKPLYGYGIIIKPGDTACWESQQGNAGKYGTYVQHLADITNGETASICDNDYSPALTSIGQRIKSFATTVRLTAAPVPGTVVVVMTPPQPNITWTLIGNTVRFSDYPERGTRVAITYERLVQ
jgi:hypothetical protein